MRKPVVSRTFHGFQITALILNLDTREQNEKTIFIERMPDTSDRKKDLFIRERITRQLDKTEKFVTVLTMTPATKRYKMTEEEFICAAHETDLLPGAENKESEETES